MIEKTKRFLIIAVVALAFCVCVMHEDSVAVEDDGVFVNQDGNVGIGTTSPAEKLDVVGSVKATLFIGDGSNLYNISFVETDPVFNAWDKSLGISITESQISDLTHAVDSTLDELQVDNFVANNGYLTNESDPEVGANTINYSPKWNGTALVTGTIFDNGNVGIGTAVPTQKLDIVGNATISGNVGIGTTTPSTLLQLMKDGLSSPIQLEIFNTGTTNQDDSSLSFRTGAFEFGMGIDRSTGMFAITKGSVFGTDDLFAMDNNGKVNFSGGALSVDSDGYASIKNISHSDEYSSGSFFSAHRSRGTKALPTVVQNGDPIGYFDIWGYDGDFYKWGGQLAARVDGVVSSGINAIPIKWSFHTSQGEVMLIRDSGNVDISGARLQVNSDGYTTIKNSSHHDDSWRGSYFSAYRSRGTKALPTVVQDDNSIGYFDIWGYDGDSYERGGQLAARVDGVVSDGNIPIKWTFKTSQGQVVTIRDSGNVGIGTANPGSLLEVSSTTQTTDNWPLIVRNKTIASATDYDVGIKLKFGSDSGNESDKWAGIKAVPESAWANTIGLSFYTRKAGEVSPNERVRIDNAGKVGIGTTTPSYALDVIGDINCSGKLRESGSTVADYVFKDMYKLPSIEEHADFMWKQKHLPRVSGEEEIRGKSYSISERREQVLEELEIAHIYIEQLHNQNMVLGEKLEEQREIFETRLAKVEAMLSTSD